MPVDDPFQLQWADLDAAQVRRGEDRGRAGLKDRAGQVAARDDGDAPGGHGGCLSGVARNSTENLESV